MKRRKAIKLGLALAGIGAAPKRAQAGVPQSGLVFPNTFRPSIVTNPSPPVTPFTVPLFVMPIAQPVTQAVLEAQCGLTAATKSKGGRLGLT